MLPLIEICLKNFSFHCWFSDSTSIGKNFYFFRTTQRDSGWAPLDFNGSRGYLELTLTCSLLFWYLLLLTSIFMCLTFIYRENSVSCHNHAIRQIMHLVGNTLSRMCNLAKSALMRCALVQSPMRCAREQSLMQCVHQQSPMRYALRLSAQFVQVQGNDVKQNLFCIKVRS